jgi:formate--tetrahydrofolate ligase
MDAARTANLDIARSIALTPIVDIAGALGLQDAEIQPYGRYVAKIDERRVWERASSRPNGCYVDVTGITPTPSGEGKTLVTVGLSMALNGLGKRAIGTIRQPSLGPVFGIKGGAAGRLFCPKGWDGRPDDPGTFATCVGPYGSVD